MSLIKPQPWQNNSAPAFPIKMHEGGTQASQDMLGKRLNAMGFHRPKELGRHMVVPFFNEAAFHSAIDVAEQYLHNELKTIAPAARSFWSVVNESRSDKSNYFELKIGAL